MRNLEDQTSSEEARQLRWNCISLILLALASALVFATAGCTPRFPSVACTDVGTSIPCTLEIKETENAF